MSAKSPHVLEATAEGFQTEVIDRSRDLPVVVDFWASWCQPCLRLGPMLERLADEYGGKFLLVKADTEKLADIAGSFGVRSIPAVYGLKHGQVVDAFVGVLSEPQIREFLDRLMPTPAEALVAEAKPLEAADPEAAEAKLKAALELAPNEPLVKIPLARVYLSQGKADEARAVIEDLERRGFLEPEAERVKAELTLRSQAGAGGGVAERRAAVDADPNDLDRRLKLAEALAAAGETTEALDICLDLVERDRKGVGESARKTMLAIFQVLPDDSEIVGDYRRRLSFAL